MRIKFEEHGDGTAVVLLHAFPLSRSMWEPQKDALASSGVRLILPDLRGFGETMSSSEINTMEEMAGDVAGLLYELGITKAVIGGLSMGGYVAFALYRFRPELFSGLVLCDTTAAADTEEKRENRFKLIEKIEASGTQALIDNMLPGLTSEHTKQNNPALVVELERRIADTDPRATIAALSGMAEREDSTELLAKIGVPTIFVFGEDDALTDVETGRRMQEQVKGSELSIIKSAGHYSNLEQPEQFNKALVSFIEKL